MHANHNGTLAVAAGSKRWGDVVIEVDHLTQAIAEGEMTIQGHIRVIRPLAWICQKPTSVFCIARWMAGMASRKRWVIWSRVLLGQLDVARVGGQRG